MNAKVEQSGGSSFADIAKLTLAILIFLAGIVGFYWFTDQSGAVRMVGLLAAIVVAAALVNFTQQGRALRSYFAESAFELRKVVWPTRDETIRTTVVIIIVVIILSLLLGLIDLTLKWAILDKLLNVGR